MLDAFSDNMDSWVTNVDAVYNISK